MPSDRLDSTTSRPYVCENCNVLVHGQWHGSGSFSVGCDCTTVPVVPQMGQQETPDNWRVLRPECCRGVDVKTLETCYGERGEDYVCPECYAKYDWSGEMTGEPEIDDEPTPEGGQTTLEELTEKA